MHNNRHFSWIWALVLISIVGCTKQTEFSYPDGKETVITCSVPAWGVEGSEIGEIPTRTIRTETGATFWLPYDKISIFQGASEGSKFTAQNAEPVQITQFRGTLSAVTGTAESTTSSLNFWGAYPYDVENTCDGNSITLTVHDSQKSVAGSFASGEFPSIGTSPNLAISFYNVCGGIYFTVTKPGIVAVTFKGNNDEEIAGRVKVKFGDDGKPVVESILDGKKEITVHAPTLDGFVKETKYYMSILPTTFVKGFTLTYIQTVNDGGKTETYEGKFEYLKNVTFARSYFNGLSGKDADIEFEKVESGSEEAKPAANQIFYKSYDGSVIQPYATDVFNKGAAIVSNEYKDGIGIITFDKDLTVVGDYAFYNRTKLTAIIFPDNVESLGKYSVANNIRLSEIHLPSSLYSIHDYALASNVALQSLTIPSQIESFGLFVFNGDVKLKNVVLEKGTKKIFDSEFYNCSGLTSITIPEGVTTIEEWAFYGCSSLTSITIPEGVTKIDDGTFYGCSGLTSITIPEGVTSIEGSAFSFCSSLTSISIPESVTYIGEQAFGGCSSLSSISIPESVTSIGERAFSSCSSLSSISIPESVTSIGDYAFAGCSSLSSISIPEEVTSIGSGAFKNCSSLTSITIPEGVTYIGSCAFQNCSSLTSITIPEGVTSISQSLFSGCSSLTSITIPEGVTSIAGWVFSGCSSLTSITIPEGVTTIEERAFYGCSSLTSITIPEGVTTIGKYAFRNCSSLTSFYSKPKTPPTIDDYWIDYWVTAYVPTSSVEAYKEKWSNSVSKIQGYDFSNEE